MNKFEDFYALSWPMVRLGEVLEMLAQESGLTSSASDSPPQPQGLDQDVEGLGQWLEASAQWLGFEAESIQLLYPQIEQFIQRASPALLRLPGQGEPRYLALLSSKRRTVTVLGPDRGKHRLPVSLVQAALGQPFEAPLITEVDRLLDEAGVPQRRRPRARTAILGERLNSVRIEAGWLLRQQPGATIRQQIGWVRLPRQLLAFLGVYLGQYLLWLLSWGVIGRGALQGRLDEGWLLAWGLLLLSLIPLRLLVTWWQGQLALQVGTILKPRLLAGALKLIPEEIQHQGIGQFLGRVIESEAVESLALGGGLLGLVAGLELVGAAIVLALGAGGLLHAGLLLGWLILTAWTGRRYFQRRRAWTKTRLTMTHDLVERLVGHRTRLAQEQPETWHEGEDQALVNYLAQSQQMDQGAAGLMAFIPRGWLVVGLVGLAPAFVAGDSSPASLAIGLGGILLAYQALRKLTPALLDLAGASLAWQHVASLFQAAARSPLPGSPALAQTPSARSETPPPYQARATSNKGRVIEAHEVTFRYRAQGQPILQNCNLSLQAGDRILLEGPSGGGKSTLASLLTGLRQPESGLLLSEGLDRQTLGDERWRQRVVTAPQFHENYVLTETFAFNLLMGRHWPPRSEDIKAAQTICTELGLSDLLERMPGGLLQMVGETGWQLSHGERSRLFLARALLQEADLTILDESFAALDPENLGRALHCALNRAETLLVIAHP